MADTYLSLDKERPDCSNKINLKQILLPHLKLQADITVMCMKVSFSVEVVTPWHNMTSRDSRDIQHWVGV